MTYPGGRFALGVLFFALAAVSPRRSSAQDITCEAGDIEVRSLRFEGNRAFSDDELANSVITTPTSRTRRVFRFFGTRYCLDPVEFRKDSVRLLVFYRRHGYSQAKVGTEVKRHLREKSDTLPVAVDVTFRIREGTPIRVATVTINGMDSVPGRERLARNLQIEVGGPFDQYALDDSRDTLGHRLRDNGYPFAEVLRSFDSDTVQRVAHVIFDVAPGQRARIGQVKVRVEPRPGAGREISDASVRSVAAIEPRGLYRERDLERAKRTLYLTDAFRHVDVTPDTTVRIANGDTLIDVTLTLTESFIRSARTSAGWATLDCFRAQGEYTDVNFLGGLRRLDFSARLSKIGIGVPFKVANGDLCGEAKQDVFKDTVDYYIGATSRRATLFGLRFVPTVTLYSERRSEFNAFLRNTPVGTVASFSRQVRPTLPLTLAYQLEYGRTEAQPALFCSVFNACDRGDIDFLRKNRRLAIARLAVTRNRANSALNPTQGSVTSLELRHASRPIGSDGELQFNRALMDASWYWSLTEGSVLVARFRAGSVFGSRTSLAGTQLFIPPQERLYAGGPNSVRGFRQNELGPAAYIPNAFRVDTVAPDTVYFRADSTQRSRAAPIGGNSLLVGNLELRLRSPFFPSLVQWAVFADAGEVWNRGGAATRADFRGFQVTPGIGLRVFTFVGPIRVDVGYNPHERRFGPAYFDAPTRGGQQAPLYCVSPTNTLPVTGYRPNNDPPASQAEGPCPPTFRPAVSESFFRRLTFNFSIGQPF